MLEVALAYWFGLSRAESFLLAVLYRASTPLRCTDIMRQLTTTRATIKTQISGLREALAKTPQERTQVIPYNYAGEGRFTIYELSDEARTMIALALRQAHEELTGALSWAPAPKLAVVA